MCVCIESKINTLNILESARQPIQFLDNRVEIDFEL